MVKFVDTMEPVSSSLSGISSTDSQPCPYIEDGRVSTIEYAIIDPELMGQYNRLLAEGYRRYWCLFYRNVCEGCAECKPMRIPVSMFRPSRGQRKTMNRNADICLVVRHIGDLSEEKFNLYQSYQRTKHGKAGGEEEFDSLIRLHFGYPRAIEMEYYIGSRLIGVGIVDEAQDALSSNYFYYDTEFMNRRLGVFSMLKEIELARRLGKAYLYPGFYIGQAQKMSYKKEFRPNQLLDSGQWLDFIT